MTNIKLMCIVGDSAVNVCMPNGYMRQQLYQIMQRLINALSV